MRRHWKEPEFWAWWWRNRVSFGAKILAATALAILVVSAIAFGSGRIGGGADADPVVTKPLGRDTREPIEIFLADFDRTLRGDSILYGRWKDLNPVEAAAYEQYVEFATNPHSAWPAPELRTPFGRALVAAARVATSMQAEPRAALAP
jgi:hypothetical protein